MKNAEQAFAQALMLTTVNFAFTNEEARIVYRDAVVSKFVEANPTVMELEVNYYDHDFAYQTAGAAAIDLYLLEDVAIYAGSVTKVNLGIAIDYPIGLAGLLLPRSSNGKHEFQVVLSNGTGLIDSDYKGTLWAQFTTLKLGNNPVLLKKGERFAQLLTIPYIKIKPNLVEWDSFKDSTERGILGLGEGTGSQTNV